MTPLMLAVASETQDAAIVRRLVHAGADVNAKSTAGETAARLGEEVRRSRRDLDPHRGGRARGRARMRRPSVPNGAPKTAAAAVESADGAAADARRRSSFTRAAVSGAITSRCR